MEERSKRFLSCAVTIFLQPTPTRMRATTRITTTRITTTTTTTTEEEEKEETLC